VGKTKRRHIRHIKKQLKEPDTDISKSVASATECTGLTRTMPRDDAMATSLEEIYNVPLTAQNQAVEKEEKQEHRNNYD
jgi:hypothetical protein